MNKRNLRKINKCLAAMGIELLTKYEYAEMIGAADACQEFPNQWNTYTRPWPIHHMAIGPIYMYVEDHPHGIKAVFSLPSDDDDSAVGEITGCTSVDEAKRSLTYSIYKAATVDPRYAAALGELIRAKVAGMGPALPEEMKKSISATLEPISGDAAKLMFQ